MKYVDKLLIQISERNNKLKQITKRDDIAVLDTYVYEITCLIY